MNSLLGDKCAKCGKTRAKVASITQWIVFGDRCNCDAPKTDDLIPGELTELQQRQGATCPRCGGSLSKHDGSLTQWVFRSTPCKCGYQAEVEAAPVAAASEQPEYSADDEALDVDAERFPLERYTALELIGSGQQGDVYKARDRLLSRLVCVKVLKMYELLPELVIRFQREAQAGGKLTHPCLTTVLDFGLTGKGQPFLVMEYCSGTPLNKIVQERGPLPVSLALVLFLKVCEGMQHAHAHGVLHRDLKASNVLVLDIDSGQPAIKIIDFGLAGLLDTTAGVGELTGEGVLMGTPAYMSPEQVQQKRLDERSDIYSIGCLMFETLTGRQLFEGESALAVLNMQVTLPPPTLEKAAPNLVFPDRLDYVLQKTLNKNPDDRFQTVAGLKIALSDLTEPSPEPEAIIDTPADPPVLFPPVQPVQSNLKSILIAVALVLLIGGATIAVISTISSDTTAEIPDRFDEYKVADMLWLFASGNFHGPENSRKLLRCGRVTHLKVIDPEFADGDIEPLQDLKKIKVLDLSDTNISDKALNKIAKISTLRSLILNNNQRITDANLDALEPLKKLRTLSLSGTSVTDRGVRTLGQLPNLRVLDLSNLKDITRASLLVLAKRPEFFGVRIGGTSIKPEDIELLSGIKSLKAVSLANLDITDREMEILGRLKLLLLDVSGNKRITLAGVKAAYPNSYWFINIHNTGLTDDERRIIEYGRANLPPQMATMDLVSLYSSDLPDYFDVRLALSWYNPQMATPAFIKELEDIRSKTR